VRERSRPLHTPGGSVSTFADACFERWDERPRLAPFDRSVHRQRAGAEDNHHGITLQTLEREVKAAGFEIVSSEEKSRAVTVVVRRPADS